MTPARRDVLRLLGSAGLVTVVGAASACSESESLSIDVDDPQVAAMIAVGRAYLDSHRFESIASELGSNVDFLRRPSSIDDLGPELTTAVQADFVAGRVIEVDGWTLSRTEVALAVSIATGHEA